MQFVPVPSLPSLAQFSVFLPAIFSPFLPFLAVVSPSLQLPLASAVCPALSPFLTLSLGVLGDALPRQFSSAFPALLTPVSFG